MPSPGILSPPVSLPSSCCTSSRDFRSASLHAASTRSSSIWSSSLLMTSGSILIDRISCLPLASTVTIPPPAVASTFLLPTSSCKAAICCCSRCASFIMLPKPFTGPLLPAGAAAPRPPRPGTRRAPPARPGAPTRPRRPPPPPPGALPPRLHADPLGADDPAAHRLEDDLPVRAVVQHLTVEVVSRQDDRDLAADERRRPRLRQHRAERGPLAHTLVHHALPRGLELRVRRGRRRRGDRRRSLGRGLGGGGGRGGRRGAGGGRRRGGGGR